MEISLILYNSSGKNTLNLLVFVIKGNVVDLNFRFYSVKRKSKKPISCRVWTFNETILYKTWNPLPGSPINAALLKIIIAKNLLFNDHDEWKGLKLSCSSILTFSSEIHLSSISHEGQVWRVNGEQIWTTNHKWNFFYYCYKMLFLNIHLPTLSPPSLLILIHLRLIVERLQMECGRLSPNVYTYKTLWVFQVMQSHTRLSPPHLAFTTHLL